MKKYIVATIEYSRIEIILTEVFADSEYDALKTSEAFTYANQEEFDEYDDSVEGLQDFARDNDYIINVIEVS